MLDALWHGLRFPLGLPLTVLLGAGLLLTAAGVYVRAASQRSGVGGLSRRRSLVLATLRLAGLSLVMWMLAGPTLERPGGVLAARVPLRLMIDVSASMAERDGSEPGETSTELPSETARPSRFELAAGAWLSPSFLAEASRWSRVESIAFGQSLRPMSPVTGSGFIPADEATDLFGAMRWCATQGLSSPGVAVVVSDGHDTARSFDPAAGAALARAGWRLVTAPVGRGVQGVDLAVNVWVDGSDRVMEGQSATIIADVTGQGGIAVREAVTVELHGDEGQLQRQSLELAGGGVGRAVFNVRPRLEPGRDAAVREYRVRASIAGEERRVDNNERWAFLQVRRHRIKVLLLEGSPYWDTTFLARTLRDDAQVALTMSTAVGDGRVVESRIEEDDRSSADDAGSGASPLADYDVVILGKGIERFYPGAAARALVDYVRQQGGALVLARGEPFDLSTPEGRDAAREFDAISPVRWGEETTRGMTLRATSAGRASPLMAFESLGDVDTVLTRLPDMLAATRIAGARAASMVLLEQSPRQGDVPAMAAVAHQAAGRGRVLAVLSDGMWRWSMLPERMGQYRSVYQSFWARAVRWLAAGGEFLPGQRVALSVSRLSAPVGEAVTVEVAARYLGADQTAMRARLVGPDHTEQTLDLVRQGESSTRWRATFRPTTAGVHQVVLDTPGIEPASQTARLLATRSSVEDIDVTARPVVMEALAESAGGTCVGVTETGAVLDMLRELATARGDDPHREDVFDQPWALAAVSLALGLEWLLRRRWGAM